MRKQHLFRVAMACFAMATAAIATAAAAASTTPVDGAEETGRNAAAVIAVDQHWLEAEVGGDTAYLADLLLPDYRSVSADGAVHPKAAIVAHAAKNRGSDVARQKVQAWVKAHPSGKSVVIHGDIAILSFYEPALGAANDVRSSDIFIYTGGRWHALYSQHSKMR